MTEAQYPGGPIALLNFQREGEFGDVRIQKYADDDLRVAAFLPGRYVETPGDTGKVEPEVSQWVSSEGEAMPVFHRYCETARAAGWEETNAED